MASFFDDFSGTGALSASYTVLEGAAARVAGLLVASSVVFAATVASGLTTPDQESSYTLGPAGLTVGYCEADLRVDVGTSQEYSFGFDIGLGFYIDVNGALLTSVAGPATLAGGDVITGRAIGSVLQVLYNGAPVLSIVDHTLDGFVGLSSVVAISDVSTKIDSLSFRDARHVYIIT